MSDRTLLTLTETVALPHLSRLAARLGLTEARETSVRKALARIKRQPPEWVVAEFIYAWGNNYSSCHIGNLDTLLIALPKYAPQARVAVLYRKGEREHAERLRETYPEPIRALLELPGTEGELESLLGGGAP